MEVTRSNFEEALEELDTVLQNATFVSIDGEFTGLNSGPDAGAFDTPAQYYGKLRAGSMDFLLVQFGLSVFTFDSTTNKYSQRSYNFYVFPRPLNRTAPDCRFMCQASSISFLANQGFDFNKLFKCGIPYLTANDEEKLNKRLEEKQKTREKGFDLIPISDDDRPQIEDICRRIDEFISSDAEELTIDRCNAFIRRLVHQEARMRWPDKLRLESRSDSVGHCLIVQRAGTKEEEERREAERREKERLEVHQATGLSVLLRKIADSGKLIVGHNMMLDLCHIIHQFFAPLPESYIEFKSLVHGLFPRLLDTKVICQSQQFKGSVLSSNLNVLLETISKPPFSMPQVESIDGRSYLTSADKTHEAGYDAYITGLCFIALSNYLGSLQKPVITTVLSDSVLLNPFLNKLLIVRLKDFPYINLVGKDPNPSRDHVFHITFPKDWKHSDLSQLFGPFGGVYVSWLSDTSAYVGLNRRDQTSAVMRALGATSTYKIQKYSEHQASLENNGELHAERKRKLSSSETVATPQERQPAPAPQESAKRAQEDNGWHVATGNEHKLPSQPATIPSFYLCEPPRGATASSVRVRAAARSRVAVERRDGARGRPFDAPAEPPNGETEDGKQAFAPILSRRASPSGRNFADSTPASGIERAPEAETEAARETTCARNERLDDDPIAGKRTVADRRKICASRARRSPDKSIRTSSAANTRSKIASASPSASPKSRRSPKKQSRNKTSDAGEKQDRSETNSRVANGERSFGEDSEKRAGSRDSEAVGKASVVGVVGVEETGRAELKRPTLKLLKSRKRSDGELTKSALIVRAGQLAVVLLLLLYAIGLF